MRKGSLRLAEIDQDVKRFGEHCEPVRDLHAERTYTRELADICPDRRRSLPLNGGRKDNTLL
jgi:hypothetical protein